jgi:dTDP-4-dehydrorhamnose 3,5-epimerase
MFFTETIIKGLYIIDFEKKTDERGFFARSFCQEEFAEYELKNQFVQCNISYNQYKGTLRGMHYQIAPYPETKLVRCTRGAIYDVVIDIRSESPTFKQWIGVELTADNYKMLYIPEGIAHGFQTLENDTEVFYQMGDFYHPECARGIRWDDPTFKIQWPIDNKVISERDRTYNLFKE